MFVVKDDLSHWGYTIVLFLLGVLFGDLWLIYVLYVFICCFLKCFSFIFSFEIICVRLADVKNIGTGGFYGGGCGHKLRLLESLQCRGRSKNEDILLVLHFVVKTGVFSFWYLFIFLLQSWKKWLLWKTLSFLIPVGQRLLPGLEVDEANAQQFVEQLGPGKRPLWAVPVVLRPTRGWQGVFLGLSCMFKDV